MAETINYAVIMLGVGIVIVIIAAIIAICCCRKNKKCPFYRKKQEQEQQGPIEQQNEGQIQPESNEHLPENKEQTKPQNSITQKKYLKQGNIQHSAMTNDQTEPWSGSHINHVMMDDNSKSIKQAGNSLSMDNKIEGENERKAPNAIQSAIIEGYNQKKQKQEEEDDDDDDDDEIILDSSSEEEQSDK